MTLSCASLLTAIKRRASLPENNDRYSDADILALVQEELQETIFPYVMGLHKDFYVVREVIYLRDANGTVLYPNSAIPIPSRAFARNIREIKYADGTGGLYNIPLIDLDDEDVVATSENIGYPRACYIMGDMIRFHDDISELYGAIIIHYITQVPTLTTTNYYSPVTNIAYNTTSGEFTFTVSGFNDLDTYCPSGTTRKFDLYRQKTGAILATGFLCTRAGVSTGYFTSSGLFTQNDLYEMSSFQEGGFPLTASVYASDLYLVAENQYSFIPVPPELDNYVVIATCGRIFEGLGDKDGLMVNDSRMQKIEKNMTKIYGERVTGEAKIIVNRRGLLKWRR